MEARAFNGGGNGSGIAVPQVVPLFPLPGHVFMPAVPAPYRVFEPRYRALVSDLLEQPPDRRWLAIPLLEPGYDPLEASPPFHEIATAGRLVKVQPLDNGHLFIVVHGELRVRLDEIDSDRPYRRAQLVALGDTRKPDPAGVSAGVATIRQLVASLVSHLGPTARPLAELVEKAEDADRMAWQLGSAVLPDSGTRRQFLDARSLEARLGVLEDALAGALAVVAAEPGDGPDLPRS